MLQMEKIGNTTSEKSIAEIERERMKRPKQKNLDGQLMLDEEKIATRAFHEDSMKSSCCICYLIS